MTTEIEFCPNCGKTMIAFYSDGKRTITCKYCGYKEVKGVVKNKGN